MIMMPGALQSIVYLSAKSWSVCKSGTMKFTREADDDNSKRSLPSSANSPWLLNPARKR